MAVNHTAEVAAAFAEFGVKVYPSGGWPKFTDGGYPPYSHDWSGLDGGLFRPFQAQMSREYRDFEPIAGRSSMCQLLDRIPQVWCSRKYRTMSREHFQRYGSIMQRIVDADGHHKQ